MPRYSFICPNGTPFEAWRSFEPAPFEAATCPDCGVPGTRDLYADISSQVAVCDDDIRRSWLGTEIDRNLQAQGRRMDPLAPKDKFDAKWVEKNLGRIHIGNDISKLRPISQRAILNGEKRRAQSRGIVLK